MKNPDARKVLINSYLQCYPSALTNLTQSQKQGIIEVWENFFNKNNATDEEISNVLNVARMHCSEIMCTATLLAMLTTHRMGAAGAVKK